jgi:hypothetical protein
MKYLTVFAAVLFACAPAFAQTISVTTVCSQLAQYSAQPGTEFKPGVDVNGNPVAPADIDAPVPPIAYPVQIPIEVDILRLIEVDLPAQVEDSMEMDASVAYVTLEEDGRVFYNGQDISDQVTHACKEESEEAPAAVPVATETPAAAPAPVTLPAAAEPASAAAAPTTPTEESPTE